MQICHALESQRGGGKPSIWLLPSLVLHLSCFLSTTQTPPCHRLRLTMTGSQLCERKDISPVFWEPYIHSGYRRPGYSFLGCVKYVFVLHNDVGNFWTHFIPLWVWLGWLVALSRSIDFTDPFWYPLLALWFGGMSYALGSSVAHAFGCRSINDRQIFFMVDYHGITMYSLGACLAYTYYERPLTMFGWIFSYRKTLLAVHVLIAINSTLMCCLTRFFCVKQRYVLRLSSYILPYIVGLSPYILRQIVCVRTGDEQECLSPTILHHLVAFSTSLIMAFFFVSKLPERLAPGRFDFFFHSHQLFHVAAAIVTTFQFYMIPIDAYLRREALTRDPAMLPSIATTLLPFGFVLLVGLAIIAVLGSLVVKRVIISNKVSLKSN